MKITTATHASDSQMRAAIIAGLKIALHLEDSDKLHGIAIFGRTIEDARSAFRKHAKGWQMFMVREYFTADDLDQGREIARGWL